MLKYVLKFVKMLSPSADENSIRLITIGISHYSEKARWALDLSPLRSVYVEEAHCPAFHLTATVMGAAKLEKISPWNDTEYDDHYSKRYTEKLKKKFDKLTVPKLIVPQSEQVKISHSSNKHGVIANGSSGILKFLSEQYPEELGMLHPKEDKELYRKVLEMERLLDDEFAPAMTAWMFGHVLLSGKSYFDSSDVNQPVVTHQYNRKSFQFIMDGIQRQKNLPLIEKVLFSMLGSNHLRSIMIQANAITAINREKAFIKIQSILQDISKEFFPNGQNFERFLFNTSKPTVADIALAAYCMPILLPSQLQHILLDRESLEAILIRNERSSVEQVGCHHFLARSKQLLDTSTAVQYAQWMYQHHRNVR